MTEKKKNLLISLVAILLFVGGPGVAYYAFELVGIPHVREAHEGRYLLVGLALAIAGVALIFVKLRRRQ